MVPHHADSIEKLINRLIKLPGIGRRSAERIVAYILDSSTEEIRGLAGSMMRVKESIRFCRICNNLSEGEICKICQDAHRRKDIICIVEKPGDVAVIEKSAKYNGAYHVLLGSISPLEGRGPADLKIDSLLLRLKQNNIREVIIATDADTEGETTALYLAKLIKPSGIKLTRIGVGIPVGSNLEYADSATLSKAMESRQNI